MVTICSVSSYLEYLLKYSLLLDNCDPAYLEGLFIIVPSRVLSVLPFVFGLKVYWPSETLLDYYWIAWKAAVYSSIENLLTVANGHTYLAEYSKSKGGKQYVFSHLACFVGGNWLLGGRVIEDEKVVNYGLQLIDTCMHSVEYHFKCLFPHPFHRHIPERSDDDLFT